MNPFSGDNTVDINYVPKTAIVSGTIWKLVVYGKGASGWEDTEVAAVPEEWKPPTSGQIPAALLKLVASASPTDGDAIKVASAISVSKHNTAYNASIFDVACEKYVTYETHHKGKPPLSPVPFYRIANFDDVYALVSRNIPVPPVPEYPSR